VTGFCPRDSTNLIKEKQALLEIKGTRKGRGKREKDRSRWRERERGDNGNTHDSGKKTPPTCFEIRSQRVRV
jgi:hypothetical protein